MSEHTAMQQSEHFGSSLMPLIGDHWLAKSLQSVYISILNIFRDSVIYHSNIKGAPNANAALIYQQVCWDWVDLTSNSSQLSYLPIFRPQARKERESAQMKWSGSLWVMFRVMIAYWCNLPALIRAAGKMTVWGYQAVTRSLLLCFITLLNLSLPGRCETPAVSGGKKKYREHVCSQMSKGDLYNLGGRVYLSVKHQIATNMTLVTSHDPVLI